VTVAVHPIPAALFNGPTTATAPALNNSLIRFIAAPTAAALSRLTSVSKAAIAFITPVISIAMRNIVIKIGGKGRVVLHLPAVSGKKSTGEQNYGEDESEAGLFEVKLCDICLAVLDDAKAYCARVRFSGCRAGTLD